MLLMSVNIVFHMLIKESFQLFFTKYSVKYNDLNLNNEESMLIIITVYSFHTLHFL